jgi:hypothetical protein
MNNNELSDAELVSCLWQDDRLALECIFRPYASEMFRHVNEKVDSRNDCEEIIVDVFITLWLCGHFGCTELKSHLTALTNRRLALLYPRQPELSTI